MSRPWLALAPIKHDKLVDNTHFPRSNSETGGGPLGVLNLNLGGTYKAIVNIPTSSSLQLLRRWRRR